MSSDRQPALLEIPEQPAPEPAPEPAGKLKLKTVNRAQTMLAHLCVEELIPHDHKARAIWDLAGRLNLSGFETALKTRAGEVGRPAWDPRLLVSIWVYAYSEGIGSAREIERLMEWEPGLQWIGGLDKVNHHTLSDFRVEHRQALDDLFVQMLALLESEDLLSLERVMHDGTKIRAQAGADTFRREKTLREHLEQARQLVESMGDPRQEETRRDGREAARERGARQRVERLDKALEAWETLAAATGNPEQREQLRVSETEPEAQRMKHGDNSIAPSYNAQITTEATNKIIVGAHLSSSSSDSQSLMPAMNVVKENCGKLPAQVVVDGGLTNRDTIISCAEKKIDLIGSLPDPVERSAAAMKSQGIDPAFAPWQFQIINNGKQLQCPAGKLLRYVRQSHKRGDVYWQYGASGKDCKVCKYQPKCCPKSLARTVSIRQTERPEVAAFRKKMEADESKAIYKQRGPVAEFPNAWIKEKLGLRKFRVRGMQKAATELIWACLTYNVMQWIRLSWRTSLPAPA